MEGRPDSGLNKPGSPWAYQPEPQSIYHLSSASLSLHHILAPSSLFPALPLCPSSPASLLPIVSLTLLPTPGSAGLLPPPHTPFPRGPPQLRGLSPRLGLFRPAIGREAEPGGRGWVGAVGASVPGPRPAAAGRPAMLITLCYLYLWVRWGRRPAALVRTTVQRLRASRCSFTFCGAAARPQDARVCLSHRGRVFCVGESQVGGRGPGARAGRGWRGAGRGRAGGAASGLRKPEAPSGT